MLRWSLRVPKNKPATGLLQSEVFFSPALLLLNFILGFLIYSNTFHAGFHFDGIGSIRDNPFLGAPYPILKPCAGDNVSRCLTYLTFVFNFRLHGLSLPGYHLVNLLLHIGTSLLLFEMLRLFFKCPRLNGRLPESSVSFMAWGASLIFLSHPIQTQAVTYIWQRFAVLATFFYVLTVALYIKSRLSNSAVFYTASIISMVCALFSKEIAATLPVMILILEGLFFDRSSSLKKRLLFTAPFSAAILLVPAAVALSGKLGFYLRPHSYYGYPTAFGADYFLTQLNVVRTYLRLLILPLNQNLDYDYPITHSLFTFSTLASAFLFLGIFAAAFVMRTRHLLLLWGTLWFFLSLSIESGFLPIRDVIFEHRLYLPAAGFAAVFSYALILIFKNPRGFIAALLAVVVIFSVLTYKRNEAWESEITIWEDVVKKSPAKARGYARLCLAWKEEKNFSRAIPYCLKAIELSPKNAFTYNNLGAMYGEQKNLIKASENFKKAIGYARKNRDDRPLLGHSYNNLANVCLMRGQLQKALLFYSKSVDYDLFNTSAHFNRAVALLKAGNIEAAKAERGILFQLGALPLAERLGSLVENAPGNK